MKVIGRVTSTSSRYGSSTDEFIVTIKRHEIEEILGENHRKGSEVDVGDTIKVSQRWARMEGLNDLPKEIRRAKMLLTAALGCLEDTEDVIPPIVAAANLPK